MKLLEIQGHIGEKKLVVSEMFPSVNIVEKTGIPFVYQTDKNTLGLAMMACNKLTSDGLIGIELVLFVTQTPDDFLPSNAISLSANLRLSKEIICFDLNQGCSGFVQAMCLIETLLIKYSKILLVTADRYRSKLKPSDRSTNAVFSDGATASIWVASKRKKILYESNKTYGELRHLLYQSVSNQENEGYLHMSGTEVWMFTKLKVLPQIIEALKFCQTANLSISNIYIHQASKLVVETIKQGLIGYLENIPSNYQKYGNTVSSSIPFLISDDPVKFTETSGVSVLAGFGVGLTSTVIIYG